MYYDPFHPRQTVDKPMIPWAQMYMGRQFPFEYGARYAALYCRKHPTEENIKERDLYFTALYLQSNPAKTLETLEKYHNPPEIDHTEMIAWWKEKMNAGIQTT